MLKHTLSLTIILFYFVNSERPGECPKPSGVGECVIACKTDNDCKNETQKCCSTACGGQICTTPSNIPIDVIHPPIIPIRPLPLCLLIHDFPRQKPGKCPASLAGPISNPGGPIIRCTPPECRCDDNCPGALKCCSNICGSGVCTDVGIYIE